MSTRYLPYSLQQVPIQYFYGGQSSDEALGTAQSFSYSRALDHRTNPSQLTVLPGPRKIGTPNDLILNIIQTNSGNRYAFGDQGNIYKIGTDNSFTFVKKLATGSDGVVFNADSDSCYFATQNDLRRMYPMSGTPSLDIVYGPSKSIDTAAYRSGGAQTYTTPTTINEAQSCYFQPDIEPFYSIKVRVIAKGTGDITLTLHDGLNSVLGTVVITAANMTTGWVEFVFSSQIRALVKPNARTYHFHVTSTIADTTIATSTLNDINTADFELWSYRLIQSTNGFHPMIQFQQFILIGNERYLAVWEPLTENNPPNNEFQRHRLTFPAGYQVCGIAVTDEFAVVACEKYATDGTKDFQDGKLFIWDGFGQTYNQVIDVAGGSPSAIQTHENYPYFLVNGVLTAWPGGKNTVKVRTISNTDTAYSDTVDNTRVYPNMMTVKNNLLHFGFPSVTNNASIEHGVYVWGALDKNYSASFNYGYVASAHQDNVTDTSIQIGCVRNFGDEMYISWKDNTGAYGLDIVDNKCDPAPIAKFRARRFDGGAVYRDKQIVKLSLITAPLPAKVSVTQTYSLDGEAYQSGNVIDQGSSIDTFVVKQGVCKRAIYGFDITSTGTTTPIVYCTTMQFNPLVDRRAL